MTDNIHKRVKNAKDKLPYQFLSIDRDKTAPPLEKAPLNEMRGCSGSLKCTLQVLNALIVGNEHETVAADQENGAVIHPLQVETEAGPQCLIPPYTLKACIRQFIASFKHIPMRQVDNQAFFYRPNQYFKNNRRMDIAAGIVQTINDDGSFEASFFPPVFYFGKRESFMEDPNTKKLSNDFSLNLGYQENRLKIHRIDTTLPQKANFAFFPYRDGIDGKAGFSVLFGKKKSHTVLGVKQPSSLRSVTASRQIAELYNQLPELIIQYHMANHPRLTKCNKENKNERKMLEDNVRKDWPIQKNDLILYEYDTDTSEILSFGKHFRYLWPYENRIWDFSEVCMIDVENFKRDRLWVTDEMFGYSFSKEQTDHMEKVSGLNIRERNSDGTLRYDAAKSGKVHFNFAGYVKNSGTIKSCFEIPGAGTPRASSYEFYVQQNENTPRDLPLNNYGDRLGKGLPASLGGRKIYRRSLNYQKIIDVQKESSAFNQIMEKIFISSGKDGTAEFRFTVHFENLTDDEFKLLIFALTLGDNSRVASPEDWLGRHCHQIGYGKNVGIGAVKILINEIRTCGVKDDTLLETIRRDPVEILEGTAKMRERLEQRTEYDFMKLTRAIFSYPRDFSSGKGEIFAFHGKIRKEDHENRKASYT